MSRWLILNLDLPFIGNGVSLYEWITLERDVKKQTINHSWKSSFQYFDFSSKDKMSVRVSSALNGTLYWCMYLWRLMFSRNFDNLKYMYLWCIYWKRVSTLGVNNSRFPIFAKLTEDINSKFEVIFFHKFCILIKEIGICFC